MVCSGSAKFAAIQWVQWIKRFASLFAGGWCTRISEQLLHRSDWHGVGNVWIIQSRIYSLVKRDYRSSKLSIAWISRLKLGGKKPAWRLGTRRGTQSGDRVYLRSIRRNAMRCDDPICPSPGQAGYHHSLRRSPGDIWASVRGRNERRAGGGNKRVTSKRRG